MAEATGIGWCDATMNPWVGCEKVSPGCAHCYAEELVTGRMGRAGTWGASGTRERTSESNWKKPLRWERLARDGKLPDGSENPDGHRPRVFCASLADVFEPRPELDPWRDDLFDLIAATPSLDWLLLTKRPEFARDWLRSWCARDGVLDETLFGGAHAWTSRDSIGWGVLPNIWIGTSIENSRFTYRADALREIPAAVRFISAEPLLGSLFAGPTSGELPDAADALRQPDEGSIPSGSTRMPLDLTGVDWVIVGGESGGRDARPMHPTWARDIRDAIYWNGMTPCGDGCCEPPDPWERPAFYFKQWGSWAVEKPGDIYLDPDGSQRTAATALPSPRSVPMRYVGASPRAGGKLLDGVEWCEFPRVTVHA